MKAEIEDDDELYIVDNNGEAQLFDFTGQDFENKLRVPLLEILKYPYLLLHERVSEYLGCSTVISVLLLRILVRSILKIF